MTGLSVFVCYLPFSTYTLWFWVNEFNFSLFICLCLFVSVFTFICFCLCVFVCLYVCFLTAIKLGGRGCHLVLHSCQIRWLVSSSSASAKAAPEAVAVPVDLHWAVGIDRVCLWECSLCLFVLI